MHFLRTIWIKTPVIIKAFVTGMLVLMVAVYPSSAMLQLNLSTMDTSPWAILPGGLFLWLWWRYLGGWGAPASNRKRRGQLRRLNPIPDYAEGWIWFSGASLGVSILCFSFIKTLTETGGVQQTAMLEAFSSLPGVTAVGLLIGLTLMTGFFEEAAFRGYMQVAMEERFGPVMAIAFVAFIFAVIHFPAVGQFPLFFFGSLGWGVLAWLTGTILPGIIFHALVDGVAFLWAWSNPEAFGTLLDRNIMETGINTVFVNFVAVAVIGTIATIYGFTRIYQGRYSAK